MRPRRGRGVSASTNGCGTRAWCGRASAAALAQAGHVRVNGVRIDAPARLVRSGDVITVALDRVVRVLKVTGIAERRGSARAGAALYEELT